MIIEHRVSIFVFRRRRDGPEYLVVRRRPARENLWNPILTRLRPSDTVRRAALRRMRQGWQAPSPLRFLDLNLCDHFLVGDMDLVDWCVGYGVEEGWDPQRPDAQVERFRWELLPKAFQLLEQEGARRALFRLHLEASSD